MHAASMSATEPADRLHTQCVGVLGGMGPLAGAYFMERLACLTPADRDQAHIPAVLVNDPRVPDRVQARLRDGPSPAPAMIRGLRTLAATGADCLVIPCNTAHLWFDELQRASPKPILHIVQATIESLRAQGVAEGPIGLLGTRATLQSHLYQQRLLAEGYSILEPDEETIGRLLEPAIKAVKTGQPEAAFDGVARAVDDLKRRGACAVILGCTELPIAIPHARRAGFGIPLTDSVDALALAAIRWVNAHEPAGAQQ